MSDKDESIGDKVWGFIGISMVCAIASGVVAIAVFFIVAQSTADGIETAPATAKSAFLWTFAVLMLLQIFAMNVLVSVIAMFGHLLTADYDGTQRAWWRRR